PLRPRLQRDPRPPGELPPHRGRDHPEDADGHVSRAWTMIDPRAVLYRLHWEARSRAEGFGLMQALRFLGESERWERGRMEALRDEKLRRVVGHAYIHSPHYRRMMDEHGVGPGDIRGVADLPKLPILTKDVLRRNIEELRCRDQTSVELGVTGG